MSSSEGGGRIASRIGWASGIVLAILVVGAFFKVAIVKYGPPVDEIRLVWKPAPGKIVYVLDFPEGMTERQLARFEREEPFFLNYLYVKRNTIATIGGQGVFERVMVDALIRKQKGPAKKTGPGDAPGRN